ncbi:hypothetical protein H4S08_002942 [Coemansia sp. RSA 1365]|nr:hypothetical protein H4S08_002942 [Coemansia sp. RSA 1365]
MIYEEDGNTFSWDPEPHEPADPMYEFYEFLSTMPLYAKKELFRSMDKTVDNKDLSEVFRTSSQMRWAVAVFRFGMQLPLEDIDIIEKAFNYYKNIIFVLHQLEFKDAARLDKNKRSTLTSFAALEVLTRPAILFNPRAFFERELPVQMIDSESKKHVDNIYESYMVVPDLSAHMHEAFSRSELSQKIASGTSDSYPSTPAPNTKADKNDKYSAKSALHSPAPASNVGKQHQNTEKGVHFTHTSSQILAAQDLWDKYISFLANVLQIYSTTIRVIQPQITHDVEVPILRNIISIIDMILSQGGANPILQSWCNRYRSIIGPELWDKTWIRIGDQLESSAIKLLMDVWGWIIGRHKIMEGVLVTNVRYWLHRDKFIEAWLFLVNQVSQRVMRADYPYDKSVGISKVRVHFNNYTMTTTMSDNEARYILGIFASTVVDFSNMSSHAYYMYAVEVCETIERALSIRKIISVNSVQYAQKPPTANYMLYYFGDVLFAMALHEFAPTKEYILAKRRVIAVFTYLLTLEENPKDLLLEYNRNRMLYAIHNAITKNHEAQAILPNMPDLLKNTIFVRPFIPDLFELVCRVLPDIWDSDLTLDEKDLRRSAYDTLSGLVAFIGYYCALGRSDLIANSDKWLDKHFEVHANKVVESITSTHQRAVLQTLISNLKQCKLASSAYEDKIFSKYLYFTFQLLLLSVAKEKYADNIRYATCIILTFLHQYIQYCPDYVEFFVKFFIDQLFSTTSDEMAITYIYGITQAASITWSDVLTKAQLRKVTTAVIDALSDCEANLNLHNRWHHYHQRFISSLRCLISWVLVLEDSSYMDQASASKLMSLLERCNKYISKATYSSYSSDVKQKRRLHLTTSCVEEYSVNDITEDSHHQPYESPYISTLTMLRIFGESTTDQDHTPEKDKGKDEDNAKSFVLSKSLYKSLYTTISVYSSIILRCMDNMRYDTYAATDIATARQAIARLPLPDNKSILQNFNASVVRDLEGYIPTSIRIFALFSRAIYTAIGFRRFVDGEWSDEFAYITSRYVNNSKQWLSLSSLPKGMESKNVDDLDISPSLSTTDDNERKSRLNSLPWVRVGENLMYPEAVRKEPMLSKEHGQMEWLESPVDFESNTAIRDIIASSYEKLHKARKTPEFLFAPATPPKSQHRGNTHDRPTCALFFGIDLSMLRINEQILRDLDQLDDMDHPFSAYAGVIYLQSEKSLSTQRNLCKGSLCGVSAEFSHFLMMLNRSQTAPAEKMNRDSGGMLLLRYIFTIRGFKVCYNLAPNISSLISGNKMSPRDNQYFYKLLRKRGIAVLWFDSYAGILDKTLAWEFIDQMQNYSEDCKPSKAWDDEYLRTQPSSMCHSSASNNTDSTDGISMDPSLFKELPRASVSTQSLKSAAQSTPPSLTQAGEKSGTISKENSNKHKISGLLNRTIHKQNINVLQDVDKPLSTSGSETSIMDMSSNPKTSRNTTQNSDAHSAVSGVSSKRMSPDRVPSYNNVNKTSSKGKQPDIVLETPKDKPNESLIADLESNSESTSQKASSGCGAHNQDNVHRNTDHNGRRAHDGVTEPIMRILIALSPIVDTNGRLVKIEISATGGSTSLNKDFENMTGPLMTKMVVEMKNIANILSATILDASANMASLQGEDFSMVYRRMEMIKEIIRKYGIKYKSADDAHKSMFPVGQSGVESTFHIPQDM